MIIWTCQNTDINRHKTQEISKIGAVLLEFTVCLYFYRKILAKIIMGRWYTNIIKRRTHVTRSEALICLSVTEDEFDRFCVLTDTHPFIASKEDLTNKSTKIQYKLADIHRIRESEPYQKMKLKKENAKRRCNYRDTGREYKLDYLLDEKIDYGRILLSKYPSFDDIYEDLGEAVTSLIITERLIRDKKRANLCIRFESDIITKIYRELSLFYLYLMIHRNSYKVFIGKEGIYYSTEISGSEIFWKESYPLADPEDSLGINYNAIVQTAEFNAYLLEKVNFRLFKSIGEEYFVEYIRSLRKRYTDFIEYIPVEIQNAKENLRENNEYMLEEHLKPKEKEPTTGRSLKDEDAEREEFVQERDPGAFGPIDILSEFKRIPKGLLSAITTENKGIFCGEKVFLCSSTNTLEHSLTMLIISGGGDIVKSAEESTLYLCSVIPQNFRAEYNYAHPQIIYDSCNLEILQSHSLYRPGQSIPQHVSPYKSMLKTTDLDTFNISHKKKSTIESIINHRK
ncbi:pescadillo [Nematocida ausubeli]|nr:pescadillo [Nematocida ausubeli]